LVGLDLTPLLLAELEDLELVHSEAVAWVAAGIALHSVADWN